MTKEVSDTTSILKSAVWLTGAQYTGAALGLSTTVVVSRLLGPEQYGLSSLVVSYTGFLWSFASFKSASVTIRYISSFYASGKMEELGGICKVGYAIDLLSAVLALLVVVCTASLFADFFLNKSFLAPYIIINALALPLYALTGTSRAILFSLQRMRVVALFLIAEKGVIFVITSILLFTVRMDFSTVIIALSFSQALIGAAMFAASVVILRKHRVRLFSARVSSVSAVFTEIRKLFAWNYLLITLTGAMDQLPILLLGRYHSASGAGFYKIASNLSGVCGYLESALRKVVYPEFSMKREIFNQNEFRSFSGRIGKRMGLPLALFTIVALLAIAWILPLLFGARYSEAIPATQIMLIGTAVSSYFFWVEPYYFSLGAFKPWALQYAGINLFAAAMMVAAVHLPGIIPLAIIAVLAKISFYVLSSSRVDQLTGDKF